MNILRLKEVLKEKGITGKELANRVEVTEASISNIVKGDSIPRKDLLLKIAEVLNVDVRELFNPTKQGSVLNGFVEYKGDVHRIKSLDNLNELKIKVERDIYQ